MPPALSCHSHVKKYPPHRRSGSDLLCPPCFASGNTKILARLCWGGIMRDNTRRRASSRGLSRSTGGLVPPHLTALLRHSEGLLQFGNAALQQRDDLLTGGRLCAPSTPILSILFERGAAEEGGKPIMRVYGNPIWAFLFQSENGSSSPGTTWHWRATLKSTVGMALRDCCYKKTWMHCCLSAWKAWSPKESG